MCNSGFVPLCPFCRQPLPAVTMAHTAVGVAPVHVCRFETTAAAPDALPAIRFDPAVAAATAAPFAGQIFLP
jgi:hypothetical protein